MVKYTKHKIHHLNTAQFSRVKSVHTEAQPSLPSPELKRPSVPLGHAPPTPPPAPGATTALSDSGGDLTGVGLQCLSFCLWLISLNTGPQGSPKRQQVSERPPFSRLNDLALSVCSTVATLSSLQGAGAAAGSGPAGWGSAAAAGGPSTQVDAEGQAGQRGRRGWGGRRAGGRAERGRGAAQEQEPRKGRRGRGGRDPRAPAPRLQAPAPPHGLPGDVVQSLSGIRTRSPSEPRGAPPARQCPAPWPAGTCSPTPTDPQARGERRDSLSQRAPRLATTPRAALPVVAAGLSPAVAATAAASRAGGPGRPRASVACGWEPARALRSGPGEAGMEPPGGGRAAGRARAWGGWAGAERSGE